MRSRTEFTLLAFIGIALAQTVPAATLTMTFEGVESAEGQLMAQVSNSSEAFDGKARAVAQFVVPAAAGSVSISTNSLPAGDYAVRVMHDENDNGELDSNMIGIPREPWGTSNDAKGSFGPPSWDDAKFSIDGDTSIIINMQ
ncbi:MAG: DUF2141 domain-containing protein [Pseudomonadaceae bacterium]|nr:DUF2141 domain-containing protein [Pseudomonadaceae bacterium]